MADETSQTEEEINEHKPVGIFACLILIVWFKSLKRLICLKKNEE